MTTTKSKNFYFTKDTQKAIVDYVKSESKEEKNYLYNNFISKVLKELIDNIVQVYNLGKLPNIDFLKEECLLYLISNFAKFDESKGSAAFTYFTVIAKNWFFFQFKKNKKRKYEEVDIDEVIYSSKNLNENIEHISVEHDYEIFRESYEFKKGLLLHLTNSRQKMQHEKIGKVLDSVIYIFENIEELDFINKKGIYVYIREISGLETKEISSCLKKIFPLIKDYKNKWNNGDI
jgi:hypothetical protein